MLPSVQTKYYVHSETGGKLTVLAADHVHAAFEMLRREVCRFYQDPSYPVSLTYRVGLRGESDAIEVSAETIARLPEAKGKRVVIWQLLSARDPKRATEFFQEFVL